MIRTQLTMDALTRDTGGFALVTRLPDGRPAELHRLDPSKVTIGTAQDGAPSYTVDTGNGRVTYPYSEIVHVQAFGGLSPLTMGREAIGLAQLIGGAVAGALFDAPGSTEIAIDEYQKPQIRYFRDPAPERAWTHGHAELEAVVRWRN
jgi:hypothetical protein